MSIFTIVRAFPTIWKLAGNLFNPIAGSHLSLQLFFQLCGLTIAQILLLLSIPLQKPSTPSRPCDSRPSLCFKTPHTSIQSYYQLIGYLQKCIFTLKLPISSNRSRCNSSKTPSPAPSLALWAVPWQRSSAVFQAVAFASESIAAVTAMASS